MAHDNSRSVLYSAVGEALTHYDVDVDGAALERRATVILPSNVQYVWPHPAKRYLYVTASDRGPGAVGPAGSKHFVAAFRIDAGGALAPHGAPQALAARPLHNCVDATGSYALIAYNNPSRVTVHRIGGDGAPGGQVEQPGDLDTGIFAHQIRVAPSNRVAILVTRGNDAADGRPEDPGALKLYGFEDGKLTNLASVAPGGGYGFGPRHLDFHPSQPWVYVSIERQNQLQMFRMPGDRLERAPAFTKSLLAEPHNERPRQLGGPIHVHPNGRTVYVSNRADHTVAYDGRRVFGGGENSIAVFSIDPASGEPKPVQRIDTRGFHVRTFALDPSGRLLVAASIMALPARDGERVSTVPAGLSVFRVAGDGKLDFVRKHDVETSGKTQFWMGIVGLNA